MCVHIYRKIKQFRKILVTLESEWKVEYFQNLFENFGKILFCQDYKNDRKKRLKKKLVLKKFLIPIHNG